MTKPAKKPAKKAAATNKFSALLGDDTATSAAVTKNTPAAKGRTKKENAYHTERSPRGRGKTGKVSIAVRLKPEDWRKLHDFALTKGQSLQAVFIAATKQYMVDSGAPPIEGVE